MLQIQHIKKEYTTGKLVQKALDDVSLNLRDNEFVAILGPSGSGKTTLLNIIGGLDRYDSGDLIINGISTKQYKDRDWDSYRNHTIGFVFQSYNLIPHQTILSNVELALTISGIGREERRRRAEDALEKVGLKEQVGKRPNQLSGGQMQRVAIARALVNNPDILLADEPTGALDSDTSIQVMDLLREVAKDRLVVMVTHNPELADRYATRIVNLRDGRILSDTDPYELEESALIPPEHKNMGKSSMSFLTALALSFHNLRTKKARTLLTSFAGSIGIIGIALILSLSHGVNGYIQSIEEETLSEYPVQIQSTGFDMASFLTAGQGGDKSGAKKSREGKVNVLHLMTDMFSTMDANDLKSLKAWLDQNQKEVGQYAKSVEYAYDVVPQIYRQDGDKVRQVNPDRSFDPLGLGSSSSSNSIVSTMMSTDVFYRLPGEDSLYKEQYDVKAGRWPQKYNECVVVLTSGGSISDFLLYTLGLRDSVELDDMISQLAKGEDVTIPDNMGSYQYEDILGTTFKLVNSSDYYTYDGQYHVWTDKTDNKDYMKNLVEKGEDLKVVGIVQPSKDAKSSILYTGIYYPPSLITHVSEEAEKSEIVKSQKENPDKDVFTNENFGTEAGNNQFDMNSLFQIDTGKMEQALKFDDSAMTAGLADNLDLSGALAVDPGALDLTGLLKPGDLTVDLPEFPQLSMAALLQNVKITATQDDLKKLAGDLLTGYQNYAKEHPEADYSGLGQSFAEFLNSDRGKGVLQKHMQKILEENGGITVTTEQLRQLIRDVMAGYRDYAEEMGYTDPDKFDEYLTEYLQTPQGQAVLETWARENLQWNKEAEITKDQLQEMADDLAKEYLVYARENGKPDPSKMGQYFLDYLKTDQGSKALTEGVAKMVDTGSLEDQVTKAVQDYMQQAMASYGTALSGTLEKQISVLMGKMMDQIASAMEKVMTAAMEQMGENLQNALSVDGSAFADAFDMNMDGEQLSELLMSMGTKENATYEGNLQKLGDADFSNPSEIDIYPKDFESKAEIVDLLDGYNSRMEKEGKEDQVISYTDMVGTLMSSVTDIIDVVSYVLIAFVAISLVVSSIMIGVITYISVLERQKEIGILRAMGASKRNISQVFNAETCIIGFCAGVMGIVLTLVLLIPGNMAIHHFANNTRINASLPVLPAAVLILLSVLLTLAGGLIPSGKAAKSDPVTALRTD